MPSPVPHMDHSLMYRELRLRNLPHRIRLQRIIRALKRAGIDGRSWADVGCSNGYIVSRVLEETAPSEVCGFDHLESHIAVARERVPGATFSIIDLNEVVEPERRFDVVSCFETLEHVGNAANGIASLVNLCEPGGRLIVTVPIEVGLGGTIKYIAKRVVYGYSLAELPGGEECRRDYFKALLSGKRISSFRSEDRDGWGTHFGFDWRDFEDALSALPVTFKVSSDLFTRYYEITVPADAHVGKRMHGDR